MRTEQKKKDVFCETLSSEAEILLTDVHTGKCIENY